MRKMIPENIKRMLYAESIGRCMNPACEIDLFLTGDITEKAHIIPYSETMDNSFENLILLCPNCHNKFDKDKAFTHMEVRSWKYNRQRQITQSFARQFESFEKLEEVVQPILEENKIIYENYYLKDNQTLWEKFEGKILTNNEKLKNLLISNKNLFQKHHDDECSNQAIVNQFILHIHEFKETRGELEKIRTVLFPEEILSIFGVNKLRGFIFQAAESLECLIHILKIDDVNVFLDQDEPFIQYSKNSKDIRLYLTDTARLRQLYANNNCFRKSWLRLDNLIFILRWLRNNNIEYSFSNFPAVSYIRIKEKYFRFIYSYCLSKADLIALAPKKGLIIVNLHTWNGSSCISHEAYTQAQEFGVNLLTANEFYKYVYKIQGK